MGEHEHTITVAITGAETLAVTDRQMHADVRSPPLAAAAKGAGRSFVPLRTKLIAPPQRASRLDRDHLIRRLDAAAQLPLTLVCAPAGFGKTTLLVDWLAQSGRAAAWLALDTADNDPTRFWTYVISALQQRIDPTVGAAAAALLRGPQDPPVDAVLAGLVHDLTTLNQPMVLILDDYHLVEAASIHHGVTFLLDHLPSQLRLVLGTRADPPLPLARLRARGQLAEFRAADLRLSATETATFLHEVMGLTISAAQAAALDARTEGWIAGLQLAALSMRGRTDADAFIAAFAGSHRFILDYLMEDVLARQPELLQAFLEQTAMLERLCAPLCDAITGRHDSQAMLEAAERANLFLVPLDDERSWYRYHQLFAEALRQRLRRQAPARLRELHGRASAWYSDQGMAAEAIEHALAAEDWVRAAPLIDAAAMTLIDHGEHATLDRWLNAAPHELYQAVPLLAVRAANVRVLLGDLDGADALMDQLEQRSQSSSQPSDTVLGYAASVRARIAVLRDEGAAAVSHGSRARELLPAQDVAARATALLELGSGHLLAGQLIPAEKSLLAAHALCQQSGAQAEEWTAEVRLARLAIARGQLPAAAAHLQRVLDGTTDLRVMPRVIAEYRLGFLHLEWNQLPVAEEHLERAIGLDEQTTGRRLLGAWLWRLRAEILRVRGDLPGALAAIEQAIAAADRLRNVPELRRLRAAGARVRLQQGDLAAVRRWSDDVAAQPQDSFTRGREDELLVQARLDLAEGAPARATASLLEPFAAAQADGRVDSAIRLLVLLAVTYEQNGDQSGAIATLERALALAEPGGYVRTFVDEGPLLARLLRAMRTQHAYAGAVLRGVEDSGEPVSPSPGARHAPDLPSEREREVLELIARGLSNAEIAAQLVVTTNTVKSHIHHLMTKLDATSRTHLLARARERRVLS